MSKFCVAGEEFLLRSEGEIPVFLFFSLVDEKSGENEREFCRFWCKPRKHEAYELKLV